MNASSPSDFERCALASGLLTQQQLAEARASAGVADENDSHRRAWLGDRRLADKLVELGRLNSWQAKQLLDGQIRFHLGPYNIIDSLGQGGMGQVFKAEHGVLGHLVAVKVLPRHRSTPDAIDSFVREIRAQARLDHQNLVRALDAGHDGNVYYLVSEYVPGCDLRKLVHRNGPLGMQEAADIILQVADALGHAHQQGLIHRDVKPGNVMVTPDGVAKLSDLGLAGPLDPDTHPDPRYGKVAGTADYLSPDQVRSPWAPTPAWDIYSLGCTLYYATTGKVPFPGGTTAEKLRAHCERTPLDPRRLNPQLNAAFVEVMADMMAKEPTARIQTALEVIDRLAPFAEEPGPLQPAVPNPTGAIIPATSDANHFDASDLNPASLADTVTGLPVDLTRPGNNALRPVPQVTHSNTAHQAGLNDTTSHTPPQRVSVIYPLLILVAAPGLVILATALVRWLIERLF